jgi:hypothetical protein
MLNKKLIFLFSIISLTGWMLSSFLIISNHNEEKMFIKEKITENAFNIVHQSLQDKKNDDEIVAQMQDWFDKGWTAQTGSIITICDNNRDRFKKILSDNAISTVCRLRL